MDSPLSPAPEPSASDRGPWGPWATLGFGLAVFAVSLLLVQGLVGLVLGLLIRPPETTLGASNDPTAVDGLYWAVATLVSAPLEIALVVGLVLLRKGPPLVDYLAFRATPRRTLSRWLAVLIALAAGGDFLQLTLGRPVVPEVILEACRTARIPALLGLAIIVAAPLSEEIFFRGFLFRGLEASRVGPAGAICLTALLWAAAHVQYDLYGIGFIFTVGLVLGLARWRTQSLVPCLCMHGLMNAVASAQAALELWYEHALR